MTNFNKKELERLASAMLLYLFSYDKRKCNCVNCIVDKKFSEGLMKKIEKMLEDQ